MKIILHDSTIIRATRLAKRATKNLIVSSQQLRELRNEFIDRIQDRLERKFPGKKNN